MKIIYNKILPIGRRYYAINLFGILFAKGPCDTETLNHEKIHTRQMQELGYIPFYLLYVLEWFGRLIFTRNLFKAYTQISYEREAYEKQGDLTYLDTRKIFSSFKKKYWLPCPSKKSR